MTKPTSWYGEEFVELRRKARVLVEAGKLPTRTAEISHEHHSDSKHRSFCNVCGESFPPGEVWYRLLDHKRLLPTVDSPAPELHEACYFAWKIEAVASEKQ